MGRSKIGSRRTKPVRGLSLVCSRGLPSGAYGKNNSYVEPPPRIATRMLPCNRHRQSSAGDQITTKTETSRSKWTPKIVLLLDEQTRVLHANRGLAGTSFQSLGSAGQEKLHAQLHTACAGNCRFLALLSKALSAICHHDSVEWELDDEPTGRLFRLHLANSPPSQDNESQQNTYLLTITDITGSRQAYRSVLEEKDALIRELRSGSESSLAMPELPAQIDACGAQLIRAREDERHRIAAELHDGIAQGISVAKFQLETAIAKLGEKYAEADLKEMHAVVAEVQGLIEEVRRISQNLAPSVLEDFGLSAAVAALSEEFAESHPGVDLKCKVVIDEVHTPELLKVAIYRITQEALQNAGKHSEASQINVSLLQSSEGITLSVSDNGIGCESTHDETCVGESKGFGFRSMKERVAATGGNLRLDTAPGRGVALAAEWPTGAVTR